MRIKFSLASCVRETNKVVVEVVVVVVAQSEEDVTIERLIVEQSEKKGQVCSLFLCVCDFLCAIKKGSRLALGFSLSLSLFRLFVCSR